MEIHFLRVHGGISKPNIKGYRNASYVLPVIVLLLITSGRDIASRNSFWCEKERELEALKQIEAAASSSNSR